MPKISPKNIAEAIYKATHGKTGNDLSAAITQSVKVLEERKMLSKSKEVILALQNILDKKEGLVRMKVTSAKNIGTIEKSRLEHEVKDKYKAKEVKAEFFENKEVLGGVRIEVGDEVIDRTYANILSQMKKSLIETN